MRTHAHTSLKRSSRSEASPCQFSTIMEGVGLAAVRRMSSITHALRLVLFQAYVSVSHCGIRPFCVFLEALLHYASPNWLADVTLCLGVASPPSV